MRRVMVLLALTGVGPACASASAVHEPSLASPHTSEPKAATLGPSVSACQAVPSTVYGDEPVVFEIEGGPSSVPADVELLDQHGRTLTTAQVALPGEWRPSQLRSGDFRLEAGSNRVSCAVTVNRELSRATEAAR